MAPWDTSDGTCEGDIVSEQSTHITSYTSWELPVCGMCVGQFWRTIDQCTPTASSEADTVWTATVCDPRQGFTINYNHKTLGGMQCEWLWYWRIKQETYKENSQHTSHHSALVDSYVPVCCVCWSVLEEGKLEWLVILPELCLDLHVH